MTDESISFVKPGLIVKPGRRPLSSLRADAVRRPGFWTGLKSSGWLSLLFGVFFVSCTGGCGDQVKPSTVAKGTLETSATATGPSLSGPSANVTGLENDQKTTRHSDEDSDAGKSNAGKSDRPEKPREGDELEQVGNLASGAGSSKVAKAGESAKLNASDKLDKLGIHNLHRLAPWLYSGSSPEGQAGFQSLRELGIKTVVSVDGAIPDIATARRYDLKYIHLPVGYAGIKAETTVQLARVVQDAPHPIYIHCHHGKHRGPAAAAHMLLCGDARCTTADAVAVLKTLGTDPKYNGLYASVVNFQHPTAAEIQSVPGELPQTAQIPRTAALMVEIDELWDRLKQRQAAGWKKPAETQPTEWASPAVLLSEHYREIVRLEETARRPTLFQEILRDAETAADELAFELKQQQSPESNSRLDASFNKSAKLCSKCHTQFRDVP